MATEIKMDTGGSVWKLLVKEGQDVDAGQTLFILEVMKMEVPYEASEAGTVTSVHIAEGDVVGEEQLALVIG